MQKLALVALREDHHARAHVTVDDCRPAWIDNDSSVRKIAAELVSHGMDENTPVAVIRWATTGRQQSVFGTLKTIADVVETDSSNSDKESFGYRVSEIERTDFR